jgi:hypothetical protein
MMNPLSIDDARRRCCSISAIQTFFDCFSQDLERHPALILNCDETHVSSRKKFNVSAPDGYLRLCQYRDRLLHFSALCTISASETKFRATFILTGDRTLPGDLAAFCNYAYFIASESHWMTQRFFIFSTHLMIDELKV